MEPIKNKYKTIKNIKKVIDIKIRVDEDKLGQFYNSHKRCLEFSCIKNNLKFSNQIRSTMRYDKIPCLLTNTKKTQMYI